MNENSDYLDYLLVSKSSNERVGNELYKGFGGEHDTNFLVLTEEIPVSLQDWFHCGHVLLLHQNVFHLSVVYFVDVLRNNWN